MKSKNLLATTFFLDVVLFFVCMFFVGMAQARVKGPCVECHAMHYSQSPWPTGWNQTGGPNRALVVNDCVGCHTGKNTGSNDIPYILDTSAPGYGTTGIEGDCLAGGNFWWVEKGDDPTGHNVVGIASQDTVIKGYTPPGWDPDATVSEPGGFTGDWGPIANGGTWTKQLTCAGTYGCHGGHKYEDQFLDIYGAHHADDSCLKIADPDGTGAGTSVGKSYRFLAGIHGIEDTDWEFTPDTSSHNVYKGVDRSSDTYDLARAGGTISFLCGECHGYFHSGTGYYGAHEDTGMGHPWIRHPTDYDMKAHLSGTEYANYNGDGSTYSVIAPVGVSTLSGITSLPFTLESNKSIVLCISCHRAHGTPYNDLLRWPYNDEEGQDVATASISDAVKTTDCFVCHTTKGRRQ